MKKTVSQAVARYVHEMTFDLLPNKVQEKAVACICDYLGCLYSGTSLPLHSQLLKVAEEDFPNGKSRIVGTDRYTDPVNAAFINGAIASAMALDDMYKVGIYHPSVTSVTAALAIAGKKKVTGKEFVTAVVMGYEISNRISKACNPSHYKHFHTSATVGCFCAAMTAAKLLECTQEQIVWALGLAGAQAGGLQECNKNSAQFLHLGFAARSGVLAALLAKQNIDGPARILEGDAGFFKAMTKSEANIEELFSDLGKDYTILENSVKAYPCCGNLFAIIDAALILRERHAIKAEDVLAIEIGTYQVAILNSGNPDPKNVLEAQFSMAYGAASALAKGEFGVREYEKWPPSREIADLIPKVSLYVEEEAERQFPANRGCTMTIRTKEGNFTEVRRFRKGDPEWPLTKDELFAKFRTLMSYVKSPEEIKSMERALDDFLNLQDVAEMLV